MEQLILDQMRHVQLPGHLEVLPQTHHFQAVRDQLLTSRNPPHHQQKEGLDPLQVDEMVNWNPQAHCCCYKVTAFVDQKMNNKDQTHAKDIQHLGLK